MIFSDCGLFNLEKWLSQRDRKGLRGLLWVFFPDYLRL